jgi:hypothetical protein
MLIYNKTVQLYKKQSDEANRIGEKDTVREKLFKYLTLITIMVFVKDIMFY